MPFAASPTISTSLNVWRMEARKERAGRSSSAMTTRIFSLLFVMMIGLKLRPPRVSRLKWDANSTVVPTPGML